MKKNDNSYNEYKTLNAYQLEQIRIYKLKDLVHENNYQII